MKNMKKIYYGYIEIYSYTNILRKNLILNKKGKIITMIIVSYKMSKYI